MDDDFFFLSSMRDDLTSISVLDFLSVWNKLPKEILDLGISWRNWSGSGLCFAKYFIHLVQTLLSLPFPRVADTRKYRWWSLCPRTSSTCSLCTGTGITCKFGTTHSSSRSTVSGSTSVIRTLARDFRRSLMTSVATMNNSSVIPIRTTLWINVQLLNTILYNYHYLHKITLLLKY